MADIVDEWLTCGTLMSCAAEKVLLGFGNRNWHQTPSNDPLIPSFYFPDFFLKQPTPWFTHQSHLVISIIDLLEMLQEKKRSGIDYASYAWRQGDEILFKETFNSLKQMFANKAIEKAVPFVMEFSQASMTRSQLMRSLMAALSYSRANPAFAYGFWGEGEGMLGVTPEMLFRFIDEAKVETMACAGTKNSQADSDSLFADPKERREHQLVVQGIVDALSPFGCVAIGHLKLLPLSHLVHLVTPITLECKRQIAFEEIVHALHPTPALGVFPKEKGRQWLEDYQLRIDRKRFGAPVGFQFPQMKQACCYVSIRNVQWNHTGMFIGAGCGIVEESEYDREWAEIILKLKSTKELLSL